MERDSLGLIETSGLVAALEAADAGSKAANVVFRGYERARAGLITVVFLGDVAAVRAAVTAGCAAAKRVGTVISVHVIARPDRQLHVIANGAKAVGNLATTPTVEPEPADHPAVTTAPEKATQNEEEIPSPTAACEMRGIQQPEPEPAQPDTEISEEPAAAEHSNEEKAVAASASGYAAGNGHPSSDEDKEAVVAAARVSAPHKKEKVRKPRSKRKA